MPRTATALTSWCRAIQSALEARGLDSRALFREAGLDPGALSDPNARYPVEKTVHLWRLAVEATGDPAFGLEVSRHIRETTFHALGYSLLASATLKDAFERLVRYFRIVTDAYELAFEREGADYAFVIGVDPDQPRPTHAAIDAFAAIEVRMCRALYGRDFRPRRVTLQRPAPQDTRPFERALKAPITFEAERNSIVMAAAQLEKPLDTANPELARMNDEVVIRYLAKHVKENVTDRVHALLVEQLPHGEPTQEQIARSLHMSLRSLQRRLVEERTSYKAILNDTRRDLALSYIRDGGYSISEITYLLGFFDTSSFSRAFKRWTGQSPSAYRQAVQG